MKHLIEKIFVAVTQGKDGEYILPWTTKDGCTLPLIASEFALSSMLQAARQSAKEKGLTYKIYEFEKIREHEPESLEKERIIIHVPWH